MGKKKKAVKPDGTFFVVVNPWGTPSSPFFINNVAAWFEVMLADDYPDMRVDIVYTQKQHTNIIVEFSTVFDAHPFVGAHQHAKFLSSPWNQTTEGRVSYVYEYNFATYLNPGPRGWAAHIPTYESIPDNFPIQSPYPSPSLAPVPPSHVAYALRPRNTSAPPINVIMEPTTLPVQSRPPLEKRDPYEDDVHLSHLSEYKDHIKEEKVLPLLASAKRSSMKQEDEIPKFDETDDFLNSILLVKKEELRDHPLPPDEAPSFPVKKEPKSAALPVVKDEEYEPSSALLTAFATLPKDYGQGLSGYNGKQLSPTVKYEDNYEPSAALLAAMTSLPPDYLNTVPSGSGHRPETRAPGIVKQEPMNGSLLRDVSRERSTTLASPTHAEGPYMARVKAEPQETHIKAEPRNDVSKPCSSSNQNYQKTRDPRLARRGAAPGNLKHVREEQEESDRAGMAKRVKLELAS